MKKKIVATLNSVAFAYLIFASFLFRNNEDMFGSKVVNPVFMPAGYAFSIWGLIYFLIAVWIIKSYFCSGEVCAMYKKIVIPFCVCLFFTATTLLVPTKVSPIFIVLALISCYICYEIIRKSKVSKSYNLPFSFMLSWLFLASIVDIVLVLKMLGVIEKLAINEITLAIILLGVATCVIIIFSFLKKDAVFSLVGIWGVVAIAIKNSGIKSIVIMAVGMSIIIVITMIFNGVKIAISRN